MNRNSFFAISVVLLPLFTFIGVAQNQEQKWGNVTGRVVWGGAVVPPPANLDLGGHPDKAVFEKNGPVKDETWIVNPKNKGLKNTFIWLEMTEKGAKLPIHPDFVKIAPQSVDVVQSAGAFVPHMVALRQGQGLVLKNQSAVACNFILSGNPAVNLVGGFLLPPQQQKVVNGLIADRIPIAMESNIHPWMKGWVRVFDHPYYAVTDGDGNFSIAKAPTGDYRLKIWHEGGGWNLGAAGNKGRPITINTDTTKLGEILYAPPN